MILRRGDTSLRQGTGLVVRLCVPWWTKPGGSSYTVGVGWYPSNFATFADFFYPFGAKIIPKLRNMSDHAMAFMDLHGSSLLYMWHPPQTLQTLNLHSQNLKRRDLTTSHPLSSRDLADWTSETFSCHSEWVVTVGWWASTMMALLRWSITNQSSLNSDEEQVPKRFEAQLAFRDTDSQKHFATGYRNWPHHQSGNISCWIQFSVWTQIDFIASLQILSNQDW